MFKRLPIFIVIVPMFNKVSQCRIDSILKQLQAHFSVTGKIKLIGITIKQNK